VVDGRDAKLECVVEQLDIAVLEFESVVRGHDDEEIDDSEDGTNVGVVPNSISLIRNWKRT